MTEQAAHAILAADALLSRGEVREAIDLLSDANRHARSGDLERALVRVRRDGLASCAHQGKPVAAEPVIADPNGGGLFEVDATDLTVSSIRTGFARSGCVLVRGLVPSERVARLVAGIDAAFAAYDTSVSGDAEVDPDWYSPFAMPDLISPGAARNAVVIAPEAPPASRIPAPLHRRVTRDGGGLWTADSPRMLFELFELVDDLGLGALMTAFLGERPYLSANKCTLRRVPPEEMLRGWHQDGAFLGEHVGAFNIWLTLSRCGSDAPGLDVLPKRLDALLESGGPKAFFPWALSEDAVLAAAGGTPIVRPEFEAGDALLFDHRFVHRTGTAPNMTRERHAIESWFFAPTAFPASQLPLLY